MHGAQDLPCAHSRRTRFARRDVRRNPDEKQAIPGDALRGVPLLHELQRRGPRDGGGNRDRGNSGRGGGSRPQESRRGRGRTEGRRGRGRTEGRRGRGRAQEGRRGGGCAKGRRGGSRPQGCRGGSRAKGRRGGGQAQGRGRPEGRRGGSRPQTRGGKESPPGGRGTEEGRAQAHADPDGEARPGCRRGADGAAHRGTDACADHDGAPLREPEPRADGQRLSRAY